MFNVNRGSDDQHSLGFSRFEDAEQACRDGRLKRCDLSAIADAMAGQ